MVCADEERDLLARREAFQLNIHGDAALVAGKEHRDIARTGKVREQLILHGAVVTEDGIPAEAPVLRKHRAAEADRHTVGNDVRIICGLSVTPRGGLISGSGNPRSGLDDTPNRRSR